MKSWIFLGLAILFEVAGTTQMKLSNGFEKIVPSILIFVFYGACFFFLTLALRTIPVSTAYAIWAGLGTALIAAVGYVFFQEGFHWVKAISIFLIILGVVGLNLKMSH